MTNWIASIAQRYRRLRARQRTIRLRDVLKSGEATDHGHPAPVFPAHCDKSGLNFAMARVISRRLRG